MLFDISSAIYRVEVRMRDYFGPLYPEKRGIEILRSITFDNPLLSYVREVAEALHRKHRDGVKTFFIILVGLISEYSNLLEKGLTQETIEKGHSLFFQKLLEEFNRQGTFYGGMALENYLANSIGRWVHQNYRTYMLNAGQAPSELGTVFNSCSRIFMHMKLAFIGSTRCTPDELWVFMTDLSEKYRKIESTAKNASDYLGFKWGFDPFARKVREMTDVIDDRATKVAAWTLAFETAKKILMDPRTYYSPSGYVDKQAIADIDQFLSGLAEGGKKLKT